MIARLLAGVVMLAGMPASVAAEERDSALRERLVMDYLRHCEDARPRGSGCVEVAERWFRNGASAFGRRVAWLHAANIYGQVVGEDGIDPGVDAAARDREVEIYRAVLEAFPDDHAALFGLAMTRPSEAERLTALRQYLQVHPGDHVVWSIVSLMLAEGQEPAPPRSAVEAALRAWNIAAPTRDGFKYGYVNDYLGYLAMLEGDRIAEVERSRVVAACGGPARLDAIRNMGNAALADRLEALRDAAELYCDRAYRNFEIETCAALHQEAAAQSESNPESYDALFLLVRIAEAEAGIASSTRWDPRDEPPGLRRLYERMWELRPDSPEARWRIARLIADSDERRAAMTAVAESAGRPESELEDGLFRGRRFFVEDHELPEGAANDAEALLSRARARLARGFPDYQFNFDLPATVPQGPSCTAMPSPHTATNTPR